jgi:hypothetical protein
MELNTYKLKVRQKNLTSHLYILPRICIVESKTGMQFIVQHKDNLLLNIIFDEI